MDGNSLAGSWSHLRPDPSLRLSLFSHANNQQNKQLDGEGYDPYRHSASGEKSSNVNSPDSLPRSNSKARTRNARRSSKHEANQSFDPTPTEYLLDSLRRTDSLNWSTQNQDPNQPLQPVLCPYQRWKFRRHHRPSLQAITADYIRYVEPCLDLDSPAEPPLKDALQKVFSEKTTKYLVAREYEVADVAAWAWVLRSKTLNRAALRLLALESSQKTTDGSTSRMPPFIPLLLLREPLDSRTFRLLLVYSLHLISGKPLPPTGLSGDLLSDESILEEIQPSENVNPFLDPNMCASFVVRLLHHARELWPSAQLPIARAFAFYLNCSAGDKPLRAAATPKTDRLMAQKMNMCLRLLSLPCKAAPFTSVPIQQQAQFELLKAMSKHQPPLPVSRRAYQGIIAVQLAHKKTPAERQSARLKAPSWPPWKEEKLGIDFERGVEGMTSRAMRVMSQMKEAGYAHCRWEEVSSIYAGWDTDRSPTIQTRTIMRQPTEIRGPLGDPAHHTIWEARIRTTRTVREAWACFLSYRDQGLPPCGNIYAAMAEKLIFRREAVERGFDPTSDVLPGDGRETFPEPSSARDLIYVHTEPPTLDELLQQMLLQGIKPRGRFLALLLRTAPTFSSGINYLCCSELETEKVHALCTVWSHKSSYEHSRKALEDLPDYLFSSFIRFLCKFADFDRSDLAHGARAVDIFPILMSDPPDSPSTTTTLLPHNEEFGLEGEGRHPKTLSHAINLVRARRSRTSQPWDFVLSALGKTRVTDPSRKISRTTQVVLGWYEMLETLRWRKQCNVEPSLQGLRALCASFSQVVAAGVRSPDAVEDGLEVVRQAAWRQGTELAHLHFLSPGFSNLVQHGLGILKSQFDHLVLLDPTTSSLFERGASSLENATEAQVKLPPLFQVPPPAILHAFVRALGLAEDVDGLLSLLRWISQHAQTLQAASEEHLNGERMMRRTLVATRMFLEGYWGRGGWESYRWYDTLEQDEYEHEHEHEHEHSGDFPEAFEESPDEGLVFADPNLQEAYDIVVATPVLGPWPTAEEVREYVQHHK